MNDQVRRKTIKDDFYNEPGAFESQHMYMKISQLKEIKLMKSKRREEEIQKIIEKNRKKKSGLMGKLKGLEEKIEISQRLLFPYWLMKYTYPQKKGFFKKKMVDSENVMVAELRNLIEEVSAIINEYQTQLEPYLREVEGKRAEAYTAQENLRASTNLPKKAQSISNYISGELIFFPYICVKYNGEDKKGKTYCRWLVLNGINGNVDKEMCNKIDQFISYLS